MNSGKSTDGKSSGKNSKSNGKSTDGKSSGKSKGAKGPKEYKGQKGKGGKENKEKESTGYRWMVNGGNKDGSSLFEKGALNYYCADEEDDQAEWDHAMFEYNIGVACCNDAGEVHRPACDEDSTASATYMDAYSYCEMLNDKYDDFLNNGGKGSKGSKESKSSGKNTGKSTDGKSSGKNTGKSSNDMGSGKSAKSPDAKDSKNSGKSADGAKGADGKSAEAKSSQPKSSQDQNGATASDLNVPTNGGKA